MQLECPADALLTTANFTDAARPPLEMCCPPAADDGEKKASPFRGLEASEPPDADTTRTTTTSSFPTPAIILASRHLPVIELLAVPQAGERDC